MCYFLRVRNFDPFPLLLSLRVAATATFAVVIIGGALGWLLARKKFFGREALDALVTLPLVMPPTVLGYYLLTLLGSRGAIGRAYSFLTGGGRIVFTVKGAVIAAAFGALPLMVKTTRAGFAAVEPDYEDAARTLGKSEWQVFRLVTLPLASRSVTAAATLAFARSLGDFGATLMVAGDIPRRTQTAALAIYDAAQSGRDTDALALAVIVSIVTFALLYATNKIIVTSDK